MMLSPSDPGCTVVAIDRVHGLRCVVLVTSKGLRSISGFASFEPLGDSVFGGSFNILGVASLSLSGIWFLGFQGFCGNCTGT